MSALNIKIGDQSFEFDPTKLRVSEAEALEEATGKPISQFLAFVESGSARALRVLAWFLLRRNDPSLKIDDVDFEFGEFIVEGEPRPVVDPTPAEPGPPVEPSI